MTLTLTPLTASDSGWIDEWLDGGDLDAFMNGWTPRTVREERWSPELCRWELILADDEKIGTVWLERSEFGNDRAHLGILIADPAFRGRGIGTEIIRVMEKVAIETWRIQVIQLRVRASNHRAIACYQRIGYQVTKSTTRETAAGSTVEVLHLQHELPRK